MVKILQILIINIFLYTFTLSYGDYEYCQQNNCNLNENDIYVQLEVPETLSLRTKGDDNIIDFGKIIKGSDQEITKNFYVDGIKNGKINIETYYNGVESKYLEVSNQNNKFKVYIEKIQEINKIENEREYSIRLKILGSETKDLPSGKYDGIFTLRATLD